jgi:hemerythrin-like domain-containing protein
MVQARQLRQAAVDEGIGSLEEITGAFLEFW